MKTTIALLGALLLGCGESTFVAIDDDAVEPVASEATVSSELSSARPLLNMGLGIVSREAWGARAPGSCRAGQVPNRVVIHHVGGAVSNPRQWLGWYDAELRVTRKWCDLMYHFGIDENGTIYEMVATGVEGAHASAANDRSVGIVLMGDYTSRSPTAAQVASLQKLLRGLNKAYGIGLNRQAVLGHRQVGQTSCPGNTAYPKLDAWVAGAAAGMTPPPPPGAQPVSAPLPAFSASASGLRLISAGPRRVVDTRGTSALAANEVRRVTDAASFGGATAVSFTATLVAPGADTFLSVFPGTGVPPTSTVNAVKGAVRANQTLVSLAAGVVSMRSVQPTHVVVDESARFGPAGFGFFPLGPTRALDTRGGSPLAAGEVRRVSLAPVGVPSTAVAAQLGLAAIPRGAPGFVSVVPCGQGASTSAVNFDASNVASSSTLAPASGGAVCITSSTAVDLVVDVAGYFDGGGAALTLAAPVRVLDTRDGQGGWKGLPTANQVLRVELSRMANWPGSAAVAFNLTGVGAAAPGFAQVWDCSGAPSHSNLNATPGTAVATFGVVRSTGSLCVMTTTPQHLVMDLVGVYR
ncbi:MAG: peptidoglycan recognition family protein [Myxococcota bacterium]